MRTFKEIGNEIKSVWKKPSPYAMPYLDAMCEINSTDKEANYYFDSAESVVLYFLANASGWRGEDAKRIKSELKSMLK